MQKTPKGMRHSSFFKNLSRSLDFRNSNKHVPLQNLYIFYMWKNIRKQHKNNKLKVIVPTWTDEFELPGGCYYVPDIQDCVEHIIKNHETLTTIPPIHDYMNRINNRLKCKIKDGYKLELQTPETIKLFGSTKLIDKT